VTASSTRRFDCRLCHGARLDRAVTLTPTPPANALESRPSAPSPAPTFPLDVYLCRDCGHAQLLDVVAAEDLFGDYRYLTGASPSLVKYAESYAERVLRITGAGAGAKVLEFGSNDGTQLSAFARRGLLPLGVDPAARPVALANERGIPSIQGFFGPPVREQVAADGPFDLVIANNVMAHIDDLDSVTDLVAEILSPDGTFVFEVGYLGDVLDGTLFDVIYHEHLDYHALGPLVPFFERHRLSVVEVERSPMQGGSIRVYIRRQEVASSPSVEDLVAGEQARRLGDLDTFVRFESCVNQRRAEVRDVVLPLAGSGKRIWGYGAAAKATTLLYHFGLGDVIERVVDDNVVKQGLFTPGHRIPVVDPSQLYDARPDNVLVFAWNYLDHICATHQAYLRSGGTLISPFPELSVIRQDGRTCAR
jgi:SAM-dependent methyltransferase